MCCARPWRSPRFAALNHALTELKRAIDTHAVTQAADLYALAWQQAASALPSEARQQRALLRSSKGRCHVG
ncbi:hypothetical protein [Streptomyces sp. enrichment culture]|uniref:hypothetical protein n=1 Tax=Streptomyces sp. enrichment culture TaxID=1795815 RepID=UPI003F55EEB0